MTDPYAVLAFDPSSSTTVKEPPGSGYGNWTGGKVFYSEDHDLFTLFYRKRRPLEQGRAGLCGVSVSTDGFSFEDVWTATKNDFNANSIEEGHAVWFRERWMVYVSYEVRGTSTWRIDVIEADDLAAIDSQRRRTVLQPSDYGLPWIKDPYVHLEGNGMWLYAAAPPRTGPVVDGNRITAGPLDATVLARSDDGRYFPTIEYVFEAPGDDSWHGRRARINSLIPWDDGYLAMFDGGRTFYDNYEEHAGLAMSPDGVSFTRLEEPWITSPHGCVRYVCAVPARGATYFYFEYTLEDGSHELRVHRIDR
ncbi:MAG: hypothetical protein R6W79_04040 [Acidimicrobiia bacterium]